MVSSVLDAAKSTGDLTFWNATVQAIEVRGERVAALQLDNGERLQVDAVVNAAGPQVPSVAEILGAAMLSGISSRSSLVIDLSTEGDPLRHVLRGAELHARSAGPGRVRVRSEQVDAVLTGDTESDLNRENIENLLERARRSIPALKTSTIEQARIGTALFPADGMPSVGSLSTVPGYYEAFANSGVILAPFLGRTLATQIVTGETHPLLHGCSPDRLREHRHSQDNKELLSYFQRGKHVHRIPETQRTHSAIDGRGAIRDPPDAYGNAHRGPRILRPVFHHMGFRERHHSRLLDESVPTSADDTRRKPVHREFADDLPDMGSDL
jgi:hypothetical protein